MTPVNLAHATSVIQWASFAGLLALCVIAHLRYAAARAGRRFRPLNPGFWLAAATHASPASAMSSSSGARSASSPSYARQPDLLIDSTYRIANGLTPSSDFPAALGAAQLYLPAWAASLTGGYGGSVELASVWVALGLGLACAWIRAGRYPAAITATLVGVVFLVTVPAALLEQWGGDSQTLVNGETEVITDNLTYAMFYNRWGWAGLIPLFMVLRPAPGRRASRSWRDRRSRPGADLPVLAEGHLLSQSDLARPLSMQFSIRSRSAPWPGAQPTAEMTLAIGLVTGNLLAYVNDIILAGKVSGARTEVRSRPRSQEPAGHAVRDRSPGRSRRHRTT